MAEKEKISVQEEIIFKLISFSGEARSLIFEAYKNVKESNYEKTEEYMRDANEYILKAHSIQTELIQNEAAGEYMEINLLMVHAQDHLMSTMLSKTLIDNMISMQKEINDLKEELKKKN